MNQYELLAIYNTLIYARGDMLETSLLIKEAKKGNKDALVKLVVSRQGEYYKLAYVFLKNKDDALDSMQDMIILLYENISRLKNEESFTSWSKTILVNLCKKKLKKNSKIVSIEEIKEQTIEVFNDSEDKMVLEKYLLTLSEKHQEVIKLRYYLDLDYESISQILNIPLGTVKSRLSVGMKNLKDSLGGEYL